MARATLDEYLYLMDAAFAGDDWHSLMRNVTAVGADEWLWIAPGGTRPIGEMVSHLYHAGEINHLRSLRRADDRWAFDRF